MITFTPQIPAIQFPRNPLPRPAASTPESTPIMADDGWQQQQDLRRFALSSKPVDIERLRMQGWKQGLTVPDLGQADGLPEEVYEENAAARFAQTAARPIAPGKTLFSVSSDPKFDQRVMANPGRVLRYLSATPDQTGKAALTEQEQHHFREEHKIHFQHTVGTKSESVSSALWDLYQLNRGQNNDPQAMASLTATSVEGMRGHIATLSNEGKISDAKRQEMEAGLTDFYRRLQQADPALSKASEARDSLTVPYDRHLPDMDETFRLARKHPGKMMLLDTKTSDDPAVARRMACQLRDQLVANPDMKDRVVILNPDPTCLNQFKEVFANTPELADFHNFSWDNEHLNDAISSDAEKSPLTHAKGNHYVSIGNPRTPWGTGFNGLFFEVQKARQQLNESGQDKKILVWTLNDEEQIHQVLAAGADGVLTDDPAMMNRLLDEMGYAKDDPRRPMVVAHRGGPASKAYPENTMPAMEAGFTSADAIEIDIVSARDGLLLFHDNDPTDTVAMARNLDLESGNPWRPTQANLLSSERTRLDHLTRRQIRDNYGYSR